jgi:hypothetical protein
MAPVGPLDRDFEVPLILKVTQVRSGTRHTFTLNAEVQALAATGA